jgi:hypothetical protein
MAIFRGIGGAGDSTTDATVTAVTEQAVNAATSATQAASSASSAASSASSASTSATNAAASASTASDAATAAQTAQTNAETAETNAETAQTAAEAAQTAAETAETNAETAETNAETAEANAVIAKNSAEAAQTAAETAETNAETAYANTLAIFGDAQDVQDAVDSASASAATATTKASEASASASNASTSETNALNSATSANTSATNASNSATSAAGSATDANTYKLAAQDAQVAAEAAQSQTENLFDQFGDQYLGSKASDPTVDNDGDPLTTGDIYWNSTSNTLRFYSGTAWVAPETIATNAATAAQTAQTAAETAQTAAETAETNAETAETNAAASASSASTSATNAANSATAASNSATAANNSASAAATSATNAENAYDSFDDRYLGVKASDPALDNDGAALLTGALYFNSTDNEMRVYTGSVWIAVVDLAGNVTVTSLTASSVDINGGTIDGVTIGGASAGAGTFTTLTADGLDVDGTNQIQFSAGKTAYVTGSPSPFIYRTGTSSGSEPFNAFGNLVIQARSNAALGVYVVTGITPANRLKIADSGDISFYEDTGTTPKLFWDASAESLGIGTTAPATALHLSNISGPTPIIRLEDADPTAEVNSLIGALEFYSRESENVGEGVKAAVRGYNSSNNGNGELRFYTGNTTSNDNEVMRIDSSGNLLVGTTTSPSDTNTIVASSGIYLGGTGAANLLDDYEEGTFTADIEGTTTAGSVSYISRFARYTKIGNQVTLQIWFNVSAGHTGTGDVKITGLPFTSSNDNGRHATAPIYYGYNMAKTADHVLFAHIEYNTDYIRLREYSTESTHESTTTVGVPIDATQHGYSIHITYTAV